MGIRLEQFIFDAIPYAPSTALFVLREEEFATVKNANGWSFDTPDSARLLVLGLHARWVVALRVLYRIQFHYPCCVLMLERT